MNVSKEYHKKEQMAKDCESAIEQIREREEDSLRTLLADADIELEDIADRIKQAE